MKICMKIKNCNAKISPLDTNLLVFFQLENKIWMLLNKVMSVPAFIYNCLQIKTCNLTASDS